MKPQSTSEARLTNGAVARATNCPVRAVLLNASDSWGRHVDNGVIALAIRSEISGVRSVGLDWLVW